MIIPILFLLFAVIVGSTAIETFNPDYHPSQQLTCEFPLSKDMNLDNLHQNPEFGKYMGWTQWWRQKTNYNVMDDTSMKKILNKSYLPSWPLLRDDTFAPRKC